MPSQPQTIRTTYAISFDKEESALMRHGHERLRKKFATLTRVGTLRFGNEQCREAYYDVYKADDKQSLHDQVMSKVEEALTEARMEMSATLQALPWRVAEYVQEQGLAPAEVLSVALEFVSRGGGDYETWAEDFLACATECLNTMVGANKKLTPEIQSMLDEAGWGPGKTTQYLVEFIMQGRPYDRLSWAQEVDLFLARCVTAEKAAKGEPDAEPEQMSLGLR